MEVIKLNSLTEYINKLQMIKEQYGTHKHGKNILLYRGHADSIWNLETTLERYSKQKWTVRRYAEHLTTCVHQIESFTGKEWNLDYSKLEMELESNYSESFRAYIPFYNFWVYLRHFGFPSPLLDWTASPYIALFFAFAEQNIAENASVYCYVETPEGRKGYIGGHPQIQVKGPYVSTHRRHFLQQCWYTVAYESDSVNKDHIFVSHEKLFEKEQIDDIENNQDVFIKIEMPRKLRIDMLNYLDSYNINHFSLFHSEESLLKTIAFKEMERE